MEIRNVQSGYQTRRETLMPFQSEKQRRYLWANEPKIAREWTDRYGAFNGGIMDVASNGNLRHDFQNYTNGGENVSVPTSFQARPQSDQVNLAYITPQEQGILQNLKPGTPHEGPMGIPNYDSFDAAGGYSNPDTGYSASSGGGGGGWQDTSRADQRVNERAEQVRRNYVNKENIRSSPLHKRYNPNWKMGGAKSGFGMGNIWRGIMSMFGGVPGRIGSLLSRFDPRQLRGGLTQQEWEDARSNRIRDKRINTILNRKAPITPMTLQNLKNLGYTGKMPNVGSTQTSRAIDKDYSMEDTLKEHPYSKMHIQNLDLSGYDSPVPASEYEGMWDNRGITGTDTAQNLTRSGMKNMEIANNPNLNYTPNMIANASSNNQRNDLVRTIGWEKDQKDKVGLYKDLNFTPQEAYEKLSNENVNENSIFNPFKSYPNALQPEEFMDQWYGGSFNQLPENKKGYTVPEDVQTGLQSIYEDYI